MIEASIAAGANAHDASKPPVATSATTGRWVR